MPYELRDKSAECPEGRQHAVVKKETGKVVPGGCHKTHMEALKHQRALTVNVTLKEQKAVVGGLTAKVKRPR